MSSTEMHTGGCLCSAVRYEVHGPLRDIVVCHCSMCQKLHGGTGPHSKASRANLRITNDSGLAWYASSNVARRGFCKHCGSGLFWDPLTQDGVGVIAGCLDQPTDLKVIGHIFVSEKADFVQIADNNPQFDTSSQGDLPGDFR